MNFRRSLLLASSSPRRHALMRRAGYTFTVITPTIDEHYPSDLPIADAARYIATKKATSLKERLSGDGIILAADTIVVMNQKIFTKPANRDEAIRMLMCLSGKTHTVITGVCLLDKKKVDSFDDRTEVTFRKVEQREVVYYVDHFNPFDKAGGYGIQEWIGLVAIEAIRGCYFNVVGLPVQKVHAHLQKF